MNVMVDGYGTIGSALVEMLLRWRDQLGVDRIFVARREVPKWEAAEMRALTDRGVELVSWDGACGADVRGIADRVHYVFHCGPGGSGLAGRSRLDALPALLGACAQGSEKGFGPSYMLGAPSDLVRGKRWAHIVSCNTHAAASILMALCGPELASLEQADFVVVRRSEDIGHHARLVSGSVVARHREPAFGTHHAADVGDLFAQFVERPALFSSDVTTPAQLMHALRFRIRTSVVVDDVVERLERAPDLALTHRFDSNRVFEMGRRHGFFGRIYSQAVVVSNNLERLGRDTIGWAFVPQEGNTLLSTIAAFLHQTRHPNAAEVVDALRTALRIPGL